MRLPANTAAAGLRLRASMPLREFPLDVEISVEPGERLAIVGPSGAGKTTALRLIAGLLAPARGRVALGDRPGWTPSAASTCRRSAVAAATYSRTTPSSRR